jgi:N-methylhydantoinase B
VFDDATGERVVNVVSPLNGGSGARPAKDAIDGVDLLAGFTRNIPAEVIESELPMVLRHFRLNTSPPAPGRWRGGLGLDLCVEARVPNSILTARGWERAVFRPWGRHGGHPGNLSQVILDPGTERERRISKIDVLRMQPGDAVQVMSAGGGGFGRPIERDPERVLVDVLDEFISREHAAQVYGVVITDEGAVDVEATAALRRQRHDSEDVPDFDFGPEREQFEDAFPTDVHDQFLKALEARVRPEQRHYYLTKAFDVLSGSDAPPDIHGLIDLLPRSAV